MNSETPQSIIRRVWPGLVALLLACGLTVISFWPESIAPSEQFQSGLDAVRKGDWKAVRMCAHRLLLDDQYQAHAYLLQGYELRAQGQLDEAFLTFSNANSHPETREKSYYEAASILYETGQFSQTILMCRQILEWNPDQTDACRLLAAAYYDIGAMVQAIDTLKVVANQAPDDHRPHYMEASILHDFERFEDATLAFEQAAKRLPLNSPARDEVLIGWGECLVRLRRHEEALEVLKPVSNNPEVEVQRAIASFALLRPQAALKSAESALAQRPMHPEAVAVAAQCYEQNGEINRGLALLKQAAELHPHELELHLRLAEMLSATEQTDEALKHRKTAASISEYRRDFSHKQQALVHNADDANLRFEIAKLAEQLGKVEIARSWLRAAVGMESATDKIRSHWQRFNDQYPATMSSPAIPAGSR